ncbi:unnamed protein product [Wickerhamomyces anomalus]
MDSLEKGQSTKDQIQYEDSIHSSSNNSTSNLSAFESFKHSFKRRTVSIPPEVDQMDPYHKVNYILANQPLKKSLKRRHLQMIAIGGTLGTGLFIGLGYSLSQGPGATLIGFSIVGFGIYCVMQAAAEMAVAYPVSGSFASHVGRFVDPALGFTIASNYGLSWLISFPSELIGCSMTIKYWSDVNPVAWVAIFWTFIVTLNLFGVKGYGESEFILSIIKVLAIIIFIIIGIVLICGGGPNSTGYIGAKYWHDPGSFSHPALKSICSTLISAGFSYGGTELTLISAIETSKASSVTRATKQVFWRIALFYITTIVVIGCLVPRTDPRLLGGSTSQDITASPFVIALSNTGSMGVKVSHFMNAVILVAVLSVGNSCVYASSRVIQSLGASGQLPSIFAYIDNEGRPLVGIIVSALIGLLCFVVASSKQSIVFTWLFSLCSISAFFTWFSICLSHIRFRLALYKQGRNTEELGYKATLGIYGSIIGGIILLLVIIGEIWISIFPLGSPASVQTFFQNCLSIPLMIVVWSCYRIIKGTFFKKFWIPLDEIDLDTCKRYPDVDLLKQEQQLHAEKLAAKPLYYRIYRFWC